MKSDSRKIMFPAAGMAAAIVLFCTLSCCGNKSQFMSVLDKADSLMADNPRAAMEILATVANGKDTRLSRQERAYFLLLRTEADYRCGRSVVPDADVREAVRYFRNYGQKDLYARALLMQGAVYQEMADTVKAMEMYMAARPVMECEEDFESLGLLHSILGNLYRYIFMDNARAAREYRAALDNFARSGSPKEVANAHLALARELLCDTVELAATHIARGMELARNHNDTATLLAGYGLLSRQYNLQKEYGRTLDCVREAMAEYGDAMKNHGLRNIFSTMCLNQAEAYASLGLADSARKILDNKELLAGQEDSIGFYRAKYALAVNEGNWSDAIDDHEKMADLSIVKDSLAFEREVRILGLILENEELKAKAMENKNKVMAIAVILAAVALVAVIVYAVLRGRMHRLKHENASLKESIRTFDVAARQDVAGSGGAANAEIAAVLHDMVSLIGEMNEACSRAEDGSCDNIRSMLDRYFPEKEIHDRICRICDLLYPGVLSRIKEEHPSLTGNDLLLIALMACGFPTGAICAIRRLNVHSLNVQKTRTARKIAPGLRLSDFISQNFQKN